MSKKRESNSNVKWLLRLQAQFFGFSVPPALLFSLLPVAHSRCHFFAFFEINKHIAESLDSLLCSKWMEPRLDYDSDQDLPQVSHM